MLATHKIQQKQFHDLKQVFMLSAWGFTMVVVSLSVPLYRTSGGRSPGDHANFMLGFFILGMFLCMMRLYQEACARRKDV